jgi:hypothetical protein
MRFLSIVAGATIALIAGLGSVSADELTLAASANDTGAPFALLNGIETLEMSDLELADTRGAALIMIIDTTISPIRSGGVHDFTFQTGDTIFY